MQDIEDLDHYEMKEEEPVDGKKSEDDGIEKENLAILEKIRKNQRQDHLNVSVSVGEWLMRDDDRLERAAHGYVCVRAHTCGQVRKIPDLESSVLPTAVKIR